MQPPGHFSAVVFRNRTWKPQFSSFVENVKLEYEPFQSSCSFKIKASKRVITWDRDELRPGRVQIGPHTNLQILLSDYMRPVQKLNSDRDDCR